MYRFKKIHRYECLILKIKSVFPKLTFILYIDLLIQIPMWLIKELWYAVFKIYMEKDQQPRQFWRTTK